MNFFSITNNSLKSLARDKKIWVAILLWLIYILAMERAFQSFSDPRQAKNVLKGILFMVRVLALFLSIFLGVTLIESELKKRTIQVVLTKPVYKWEANSQ